MDIIDKIRQQQVLAAKTPSPLRGTLQKHQPEMLYIGCIDARLDPIDDIGIPSGVALIHRTIGALVAGLDEHGNARNISEAASVEFAVNVMKVKHIVVSGHTCCGGLEACIHGSDKPQTQFLNKYLGLFKDLITQVLGLHEDHDARAHAMEEGSVRKSIDNLMSYPFVRDAVRKGDLQLHGWVIDTATKGISEMDPTTKRFVPMAKKYASLGGGMSPG